MLREWKHSQRLCHFVLENCLKSNVGLAGMWFSIALKEIYKTSRVGRKSLFLELNMSNVGANFWVKGPHKASKNGATIT